MNIPAPGRRLAGHPHARVLPVVHRCLLRRRAVLLHSALPNRGLGASWPACDSASIWKVQCATSKCSPRHSHSASSTRPPAGASASSVTTTCAERTGDPEVIVHACRSCTSRTPSTPRMCSRTWPMSTPGRGLEQHVEGVAQEVQGARQDQAPDDDGGDGVGRRPAGAEDDQRGDDDRDRSQRVGEHLQVGAADVERLRLPGAARPATPGSRRGRSRR